MSVALPTRVLPLAASAALFGNLPDVLHDPGAFLRALDPLVRQKPQPGPPNVAALRHFQRAGEVFDSGDTRAAIVAYAAALEAFPGFAQAYAALGLCLGQVGERAAEIACYEIALWLMPDFAEAWQALGSARAATDRPAEAAEAFRAVARLRPGLAQPWHGLGRALAALGRPAEAAAAFAEALTRAGIPERAELHLDHGNALHASGDLLGALDAYIAALQARPDYKQACSNGGCVLLDLGRIEEAIGCFQAAIGLDPNFADAHRNLGVALQTVGRFDDAARAYRAALRLRPGDAAAAGHMATVLMEQGRLAQAEDAFALALTLAPEDAKTRFNHSLLLLKAGRLRDGWAEHEWRWRGIMPPHGIVQPQWRGEPASGKRILLHFEQGLGDTLQFARYAPMVAARGLRVVLEVQAPLVRLMRSLPGIEAVIPAGAARPTFDLHCPLMSLPFACGTDLDTIPASAPYLDPPAGLEQAWRAHLPDRPGVRVGLVWAGNSRPEDVRNHHVDKRRSAGLAALAPLSGVGGVHWFSLQKLGPTHPEIASRFAMTDLMPRVTDFADTAALVMHLDLVITVDTSVAHLAGALGKPVWMLSRFDGCWRWLHGRDDTPWYPTMRLYRQEAPGDWAPVVARVADDLARLVARQA